MSRRKTRYPGVYRYLSRRGRKFDTFQPRMYDPSEDSGQKWIGTFATAREAHQAKLKAEEERDRHLAAGTRTLTHSEYAETWLINHPRSESSMNTYENCIRQFLRDFGERKLGSIPRQEARTWAIGVSEMNRRTAQTMLADAFDDGLIDTNPLSKLRLPQSRGRRDQEPPSAREVLSLARTASASGFPHGSLIGKVLLFGFGSLLRPNEICALEWGDISLDEKTINVARGMDRRGTVGPTKSGTVGMIALTPLAEEVVRGLGPIPADQNERIFSAGERTLTTPKLSGYWRSVRALHCSKTGESRFGDMPLYLFTRHAGATFMRNTLGVRPEDVEMQLRHKGENLLDLYTHPTRRPAIDRVLALWPADLNQFVDAET